MGIISLGSGYYLAQTVPANVEAVFTFFPAVMLVIIGTYLLFAAGSIAVLKILKKKKKFYYHPRHFTTISQMIYRMKQNAVGLANISILSTMVIVTLSTTTSLYIGTGDLVNQIFPRDVNYSLYSEGQERVNLDEVDSIVKTLAKQESIAVSNPYQRTYIREFVERNGQNLSLHHTEDTPTGEVGHIYFFEQKDFPDLDLHLQADEVAFYSVHAPQLGDTLTIGSNTYQIVQHLDQLDGDGAAQTMVMESYFVIVKDETVIQDIYEAGGFNISEMIYQFEYGFDIDEDNEEVFCNLVNEKLREQASIIEFSVQTKRQNLNELSSLYGGLFFIGLFLGAVFIIATVLIIYYKQISEGYDDAERFKIMKKVGMSQKEIKKTIQTQILGVFFLPLLVACVHMIFAFRLIEIILSFLQLSNTGLFMICCLGVVGIFTLFYTLVFLVTSREYYKIVH